MERPGFCFQQRRSKIDVRSISKLDLDKIVREVDVEMLQKSLENITFGKLELDDLKYMPDDLIIRLFQVAQYTIEYLLFAQEELTSNLHVLACKYVEKKR